MSLPPDLPPGLPPLPKSLSTAASNRATENIAQMTGSSALALENQRNIEGTNCSRKNHREGSVSSTQDSTSDRESVHSRASSSLSTHDAPTSTSTLDTQIALLRREMYSLRQLDLSLLSQLWALNESIQSFRTVLQDRENISPSPTPSNTNSLSSDDEPDDQSFSPLPQAPPISIFAGSGSSASTSTSASNSLSAANTGRMQPVKAPKHSNVIKTRLQQNDGGKLAHAHHNNGKMHSQQAVGKAAYAQHFDSNAHLPQNETRSQFTQLINDNGARSQKPSVGRSQSQESHSSGRTHPQLPPILQQRMKRPPPPPPPSRNDGKSPNRNPEQKLTI